MYRKQITDRTVPSLKCSRMHLFMLAIITITSFFCVILHCWFYIESDRNLQNNLCVYYVYWPRAY